MKPKGLFILIPVTVLVLAVGLFFTVGFGGGSDAVTLQGDTQRYTVKIEIDAAKTGSRTADIEISGRTGAPDPDSVTLEPFMVAHSHAAPAVTAVRTGPWRFRAGGDLFVMGGAFELTVALTSGGQREQVTFPVTVKS
ncbi:hypothetical protein [Amycolatopsis sp. MtRt-6]|uniref:hypothetical protein n=1 Tax=Amycolatopsis sp. MtRt-6 TaxID=2792782 RepID=UPI001A8D3670|nr:hypothetical protein [Amycolatopsis sp. MtRt-6]